MSDQIEWPDGKAFAFTIFDDTDLATLGNVSPVYDVLADLGFRTTKSVWPLSGDLKKAFCPGETCEDPDYRAWLLRLQEQGFEIALHDATYHTSNREETIRGLDEYKKIFGRDPVAYVQHGDNAQAMYWGRLRLTGVNAIAYTLLTRFKRWNYWRGHIEGDPLFWGDVCKDRVKYVRNFVFPEINTLRACPFMPYHDTARPYVNYWFASTEGARLDAFNRVLCPENQDVLEAEGGACIVYTHLASGFADGGKVDDLWRRQMERLAKKNGWFVSVATLLDYIQQHRGRHEITRAERARLERKWLWHKIRVGTT
ncbi:MAG: hypothetical protein V3V75_03975 [Thermoguttaceae bacterium]